MSDGQYCRLRHDLLNRVAALMAQCEVASGLHPDAALRIEEIRQSASKIADLVRSTDCRFADAFTDISPKYEIS